MYRRARVNDDSDSFGPSGRISNNAGRSTRECPTPGNTGSTDPAATTIPGMRDCQHDQPTPREYGTAGFRDRGDDANLVDVVVCEEVDRERLEVAGQGHEVLAA